MRVRTWVLDLLVSESVRVSGVAHHREVAVSEKYRCYYSPLPDFLFIFPCALVYLTAYLGEATHRGHAELR